MTYRKGVPSWYSGSKDNLYYQDNFEDDRKYDNPVQEFMLKNKGEFFKIEERETPKYLELPTSLPPKNREQFEPTQKEEPTSIPFEYQGKYKNVDDLAKKLDDEASPYNNTFYKIFGAPQKIKDDYHDKHYGGEFEKRAKEIWDNELKKDNEALKGFQDKNGFSKFLDVTAEKARREFTGGTHKNIIQNQDLGTVGNVASDIIGGVAGFLNPEMGVAKTSQFAEGLSNKFIKGSGKAAEWGKTALKGGLETLPQDFIRSNSEGEDLQGAAESALKQGLLGAGFEVGLKGVGKAINSFSNPIGVTSLRPQIEVESKTIPDITKPIDMGKVELDTPLNVPKKEKLKVMPANVEHDIPQIDIDIPQNEIASTALPSESKFKTNTWRNSEFMQDPATQKVIDDINAVYEVKPNQQSFEIANNELNKDFDGFVNRIKTNGIKTAEDSVGAGIVTNKLLSQAKENGDYSQVKDWLQTVRPQVTDIAQSLQALSTWKQLTPEGTLLKAQRVVDSATEEIKKSNPRMFNDVMEKVNANPDMSNDILKKAGIPQLTNDDVAFITNQMDKIEGMENGRAKDIEFAKVKQLIADKVPSTFDDKISSMQRMNLLLNTKTMTRNVLGNVVMGGLENIKDIPATLIDKAIGSRTGSRTTTIPNIPTQLKGLQNGFKEAMEDYKLGVNTNPSSGQFDLPSTQAFKKGLLGKAEGITSLGLTLGDRPFWQSAYDEALRQQMKLNNVKDATDEMIEIAKNIADDKTFQNKSKLSDGVKSIQTGLNKIGAKVAGNEKFGLGNIAMPFVKTPGNILDKALDYSPAGVLNGAKDLYKGFKGMSKGIKFDSLKQKKAVDELSRGLTGTLLGSLGYSMASNGDMVGSASDDKDAAALEKQVGKLPYSLKLGDVYRTLDWMQPAAIPLMAGADIFKATNNKNTKDSALKKGVMSGGATLFNQSLLQGMNKLFGGYQPSGGENFMEGLLNTALQAPEQFIPFNSALKQITQLTDNKVRDSYDSSTSKQELNRISSKIPILSKMLPQSVNTMGKDKELFNGSKGLEYVFDTLFNPGYSAKYNPSPGEQLALNIYENGGGTSHFPKVADKKIEFSKNGKKETFNLTAAQRQEYQKLLGENTAMEFDKLGRDSSFAKMSTESQSEKLEKILSKVSKSSKEEMIKRLKNNR